MVDFCMSQAAVGQRSAHNPQCTQTSSSLTMTRPVCGSAAETYSAWCRIGGRRLEPRAQLGLRRRWARWSGSRPDRCRCRRRTRCTASRAKTVCTSQFRQRCTSRAASSAVNPSSTSTLIFLKRSIKPTCGHEAPLHAVVFVLVRPLVHAHLAAGEVTPRGMRSSTGSSWQYLWMEIAAWWPCSTDQMMFFGPKAASPPKKTCGSVD